MVDVYTVILLLPPELVVAAGGLVALYFTGQFDLLDEFDLFDQLELLDNYRPTMNLPIKAEICRFCSAALTAVLM